MGNQSFQRAADAEPSNPTSHHSARLVYTGRYHLPPKMLEDDYDLQPDVLGRGASGKVYLARERATGKRCAVKSLQFKNVPEAVRQDVKREAEVFLGMDHPRIARLMDVYESENQLRLVMECMEGGELFDRVVDLGHFSEKDAADAVWQILLALNYIHSHGVVHRDVKLENFMYQKKDDDQLKLIDFGFAKVWEPKTKLAASCGTLSYVAPEVLDKSYTSQCDMWSLGVVVFILLVGYMPFDGSDSHQIALIKSGMYEMERQQWDAVSQQAKDLVRNLLVVDPTKRLTAEQALHHPWIARRDEMQAATHAVDGTVVDALCKFARASKFRRACMSVMAWSLSYEDRLSVRDAFLELDTTRKGTIKLCELKEVLENKFHVPDEEVMRIFKALDSSHESEVHYSDFLAAMASTRIALRDELLRATFKRFDTSCTGCITKGDLRQVLGDSFEGEKLDDLIKEVDANHDGEISYEEFIDYLRGGSAHDSHVEAANRVIDSELSRQQSQPDLAPVDAEASRPCKDRARASSQLSGGGSPGRSQRARTGAADALEGFSNGWAAPREAVPTP
uniref:Calmodulin n=1 Tax=Alexandrium monilatum TaxID=311494 RepID=A0A7S4RVJ7_9DINO|mmetsp:Transcript_34596/g.103386  ORF Transcript_34596/g.103386 Transcript_34596/m.103386 type:complete len:564 (+) Transcript_34596:86-1777(+)